MAEGVNGLPLFKTPILKSSPQQTGSCHNWRTAEALQAQFDWATGGAAARVPVVILG
jgi:hypothetical protein